MPLEEFSDYDEDFVDEGGEDNEGDEGFEIDEGDYDEYEDGNDEADNFDEFEDIQTPDDMEENDDECFDECNCDWTMQKMNCWKKCEECLFGGLDLDDFDEYDLHN